MRAIFRLLVLTIAFDFCTAGSGVRAQVAEASMSWTPPLSFSSSSSSSSYSSRAPARTHVPPHHRRRHHTPDPLHRRHRPAAAPATSLPFSMELRRRPRGVVSNDDAAAESRRRLTRRRRFHPSVFRRKRSTGSSGTRVQYSRQEDRQFRQRGDLPLYLSSNSTGATLELATQNSTHDNHTRFRLHIFDLLTLDTDSGEAVVMQTPDGGHFLHADSSGNLSLLAGEGVSISEVKRVDNKFFLLHAAQGDTSHQIKHLLTGRYLSAGEEGVSLVTSDQGVTDDMLFDMFSCS